MSRPCGKEQTMTNLSVKCENGAQLVRRSFVYEFSKWESKPLCQKYYLQISLFTEGEAGQPSTLVFPGGERKNMYV